MSFSVISTPDAPQAIGTYSQAIQVGQTVYLSGQIPLDPVTMTVVSTEIEPQLHQVFKNLQAVAEAAGGSLKNLVKLTVYLTDLNNFPRVNEIMAQYCEPPYPARAAIGVAALPRGVGVEIEGILVLPPESTFSNQA